MVPSGDGGSYFGKGIGVNGTGTARSVLEGTMEDWRGSDRAIGDQRGSKSERGTGTARGHEKKTCLIVDGLP